MPLSRDERGGGTNRDGSKSEVYCSHCYERGQFMMPDLTAEQMQERVTRMLTEGGAPRLLAARLTRNIPGLKRWRKSP